MHRDDMPTMEERYAGALESAHLKLLADARGAVDFLIASGWANDSLGVSLIRLRIEFDAVNDGERQRTDPANAFVLTMNKLSTLRPAMQALDRFAQRYALRKRFEEKERRIFLIAGRALALWMAPNCWHCGGRGFNGGYGVPQVLCMGPDRCGGTGKRRTRLADNNAGHEFGRALLCEMDRKADNVARAMGVRLKG
jgi:hypothetical protein